MTVTEAERREPPKVSGGEGPEGHLQELRDDPIALMRRVRAECGDVGEFRLAGNDVVLLTGAEANEVFFRAEEEVLDQAEAYPFMKPIFGEGVVFDASPERRREMLHNQALRDKYMRGHAATIQAEVEAMVATWEDEGEIDLLDWFAELTIYTSSACLIGKRFRDQLDGRFASLYHDLEKGTDAIAYVDPYAPGVESFRKRDGARGGRGAGVAGGEGGRRGGAAPPAPGPGPPPPPPRPPPPPGVGGRPPRARGRGPPPPRWSRRSWTDAVTSPSHPPRTSATCSTCSCPSRTTTATIASRPT